MEDLRISRRKGLTALGATVGAALLGTSLAEAAKAAPAARRLGEPEESVSYSVTIHNDSKLDNRNAILFQEEPSLPSQVATLAWQSKMCHPGTNLTYKWEIEYDFVWGQVGSLKPGTTFNAGQILSANLADHSMVSLSYLNGGFEFGKPTDGSKGSLRINTDDTVPGSGSTDQGTVGVGMAGFGTFITLTEPNDTLQFQPNPTYWVAFGAFQESQVMTISSLTNATALEFSNGLTHADAHFNGKTWEITYNTPVR